ncbi:CHC2 zinc finger domain-containing protein [Halalkalibacter kiskunsagensis]|uniref:CHC2 zinc finger domain-containing protein n=1 Tax=Halalkalibacter kiskunsagensis TaxID=1548599 RepID=A0ABV6KGW3_9BACI
MSGALIEMIKEKVNVEDVLETHLGVDIRGINTGRKSFNVSCPFHLDKHPSLTVWTSTNQWKCWAGCGSGDVINLLALGMGISNNQAIMLLARDLGINKNVEVPADYTYKANKRLSQRRALNSFKRRHNEAFTRVLLIEQTMKGKIRNFTTVKETEGNHLMYHYLPYLSNLLDLLVEGDFEEQVDTVLLVEHLLEGEE